MSHYIRIFAAQKQNTSPTHTVSPSSTAPQSPSTQSRPLHDASPPPFGALDLLQSSPSNVTLSPPPGKALHREEGGVLIGTESSLSPLDTHIQLSAVVQTTSLTQTASESSRAEVHTTPLTPSLRFKRLSGEGNLRTNINPPSRYSPSPFMAFKRPRRKIKKLKNK